MPVGVGSDEGREEGGKDEGEEDEARAKGVPPEQVIDAEGDDGIPGSKESGLHQGAVEGGKEAVGGKKSKNWRERRGFWRKWGIDARKAGDWERNRRF